MYATKLSTDERHGTQNKGAELSNPSLEDIETAISRLDQERYTLAVIGGEGEAHFSVGGGAGKYFVYATFDNERFFSLRDETKSDESITMNIGGQPSVYASNTVVDMATAFAAAKTFAKDGELDEHFDWANG